MVYLFTIAICLITGVVFKNTKIIGFFGLMVLAYITGFANPLTTLDYGDYLNHYNIQGFEVSPFEKGYTLASSFFLKHGFDYTQFRIIISYIAFICIFIGICYFTNNVALFTGIYGVSFFFLDAIQIRNLIMFSILILGAGVLSINRKKNRILGLILIFISTQFHDLGYIFLFFFLILNFINMEKIEKYFNLYVGLSFSLGVILFAFNSTSLMTGILARLLSHLSSRSASAENMLLKYGRGNSISTIFIVWFTLILLYISLRFIINDIKSRKICVNDNKVKILFIGCMVSFMVSFLVVLAPDYLRLERIALYFFIIFLCMIKDHIQLKTKVDYEKLIIIFSLLLVSTYINNKIWGPEYWQSIPFLIGIK